MKKVMFAVATVAIAMCSQAASLDWSLVNYSATSKDASYAGWNVYICDSIAEFTSEANIADYVYGTEGNSAATKLTTSRSPWIYGTGTKTIGGIDAGDEGSKTVYAVIVSSDGKGYWTISTSGEVYTTATEPTKATFDAKSLVQTAYTPWKSGGGDIPEPTSGLLLLVGGAMLALRRRR